MPTAYTPVATWDAEITLPSDADTRDAASVNVAFEGLADRTEYLATQMTGRIPADVVAAHAIQFTFDLGAGGWYQDAVTPTSGIIYFQVRPPVGTTIIQYYVMVDGDGGGVNHGGLMPATKPAISLVSIETAAAGGTAPVVEDGPHTDAASSTAVYEAIHAIDSGAIDIDVSSSKLYFIKVTGEFSTNAQDGALQIRGAFVLCQPTV